MLILGLVGLSKGLLCPAGLGKGIMIEPEELKPLPPPPTEIRIRKIKTSKLCSEVYLIQDLNHICPYLYMRSPKSIAKIAKQMILFVKL